jgi:viroplasmin and RNaseH domain-containing protein
MGQNKESTLTNKQSVAELLSYATDDLKLNLNELPAGMRDDLITILLGYMNLWTGWKYKGDFLAGKFTKTHYFERFQKYMCYKMKNTVQWVYAASVVKDLDDQQIKPVILNKPNNTDVEFSPYAIEIQCPPDMLSTLVFSNIGGK